MVEVNFKAHEMVHRAGEPLRYFYLVEDGYFLIEDADGKGAPTVHGPAFPIGHMAIFHGEPLNHNMSAIDDVVAWAI